MLDRWIPRSAVGAAAVSFALTIAIGFLFTVLGTEVLRSYGWGLYVALPFCLGLFSCWCTATTSHVLLQLHECSRGAIALLAPCSSL